MATPLKTTSQKLTSWFKGNLEAIPLPFRAKIGLRKEVHEGVPLVQTIEDLDGALVETALEQSRTDERKQTDTFLDGDLNTTLPFEQMLPDGQIGRGVRSYVDEGTELTVDALTAEARQENTGNNKLDQTIVTKSLASIDKVYATDITDPIPEEFKVLVPVQTQELPVVGEATEPTLGEGELERRERQVTKFVKSVYVRFRSLVGLPVSLQGSQMFEGIEATNTRTLATGVQTISPDFKTVSGSVRNTGAGTSVKEKVTVESYPDQPGQLYIEDLDAVIPYVQKTVVLGTGVGVAHTESTPVDFAKSRTRTFDLTAVQAVLDAVMISYPARQDIRWPSVLVGIDAVWEEGEGVGTADETGAGVSSGTNVSLNLNTSTQAQSSKHAIPQLVPHIIHPYGDNKSCTDYYFFMPFDFTESDVLGRLPSVVAWPNFNPVTRTFILIGQKVAITAHAAARSSQSWSDSGSSIGYSQGGGSSVDIGPSVIEKTIGPVIHGELGVAGDSNKIETVSVHARANMYPLADSGSFDPTATVNARIEPYTYPATDGDFAIPTDVDVLLHVEASIYQRGKRMAVRARVAHL